MKIRPKFHSNVFPPYHHEFVISNGRVLIGKVAQPKSLWCRNISKTLGDFCSQNENIGWSSPVKCMYRYLGVQLVQEVHELLICNFHFVFQRQLSGLLIAQCQQKFPFRDERSYLLSFWTYSWSSFGSVPGTSYAKLTITLFLSYFEYCFWAQKKSLQLT